MKTLGTRGEDLGIPGTVKQMIGQTAQTLSAKDAEARDAGLGGGGVAGVINGLFQSMFGGDGKSGGGGTPGLGVMGDFNLDQFIEGSLAKSRDGKGGEDLAKGIGSLMQLFGGGAGGG